MTVQDDHERIDSAQHTWVFDRPGRRFSRVPRDRDPTDPAVAARWVPYFDMTVDADGSAFTVLLDALGTRLMRAGIE